MSPTSYFKAATETVREALDRTDAVIHSAALVGVGQSMYRIADYTCVKDLGTACLLEALSTHPVECLAVASSKSVCGEGSYRDSAGNLARATARTLSQLKMGAWEVFDSRGEPLTPVPTTEDKQPSLASIYTLSKCDQERMCLIFGMAYRIPVVAPRIFST